MKKWVAIQLGSREHFSIPVALAGGNLLERCLTDFWLPKPLQSLASICLPSLLSRRNHLLDDSLVQSNSLGRLFFDRSSKSLGVGGWDLVVDRNEWFGKWCSRKLRSLDFGHLFSYSYTALHPFGYAKSAGIQCILGQIDPGPMEEIAVQEATSSYRHLAPNDDLAPARYWDRWHEEILMADKVVVNSPWSLKLLSQAGVDATKMVTIPLVYDAKMLANDRVDKQSSPSQSGTQHNHRPKELKVLFLGSVILRKGIGQLFDAIHMLRGEPVNFTFAGPIGVRVPPSILSLSNVKFLGPVSKVTATRLYYDSDVFLFPTLSDGFGLTQLEALGHGLPVIASTRCGQVVDDRVNGLLLEQVTPAAIAQKIFELIYSPSLLQRLKSRAFVPDRFCPRSQLPSLLDLANP